jgi:hypothetical protein
VFDFGRVDGVAPVVPRAIFHEGDEVAVRAAFLAWHQAIERVANGVRNVDVGALVVPPDIVRLTG